MDNDDTTIRLTKTENPTAFLGLIVEKAQLYSAGAPPPPTLQVDKKTVSHVLVGRRVPQALVN